MKQLLAVYKLAIRNVNLER